MIFISQWWGHEVEAEGTNTFVIIEQLSIQMLGIPPVLNGNRIP
jgi:hypothetical protein